MKVASSHGQCGGPLHQADPSRSPASALRSSPELWASHTCQQCSLCTGSESLGVPSHGPLRYAGGQGQGEGSRTWGGTWRQSPRGRGHGSAGTSPGSGREVNTVRVQVSGSLPRKPDRTNTCQNQVPKFPKFSSNLDKPRASPHAEPSCSQKLRHLQESARAILKPPAGKAQAQA